MHVEELKYCVINKIKQCPTNVLKQSDRRKKPESINYTQYFVPITTIQQTRNIITLHCPFTPNCIHIMDVALILKELGYGRKYKDSFCPLVLMIQKDLYSCCTFFTGYLFSAVFQSSLVTGRIYDLFFLLYFTAQSTTALITNFQHSASEVVIIPLFLSARILLSV